VHVDLKHPLQARGGDPVDRALTIDNADVVDERGNGPELSIDLLEQPDDFVLYLYVALVRVGDAASRLDISDD
jgi:hypothetical protein